MWFHQIHVIPMGCDIYCFRHVLVQTVDTGGLVCFANYSRDQFVR